MEMAKWARRIFFIAQKKSGLPAIPTLTKPEASGSLLVIAHRKGLFRSIFIV
jgi:hypothetical protein